jgi:hypothetical protein
MQDLYFVYFYNTYCYIFLMANLNYIPVYMKVYYLFTLCLFKVGRLFSKLAIPKYMFVFVIKLSKEKTYFMYGGTWLKCIVFYSHECLCEIMHLISTVVCQMSTLYCGRGVGSRNSSCMPRCQFNVLNVQLQKYIYYWTLEFFKSTFCSYLFSWF